MSGNNTTTKTADNQSKQHNPKQSSAEHATTIASWAAAIERALQAYGCDPEPLFKRLGIDQRKLGDPEYRIPVKTMTLLWRASVALTGDDCFGLRVAEFVSPTTFHALGYAAMASRNFQDAIGRVVRNAALISEVADLKLEIRDQQFWLCFHLKKDSPEVADEAIDAFLASLVFIARRYLHASIPLAGLHLKRAVPSNPKRFHDFFEVEVSFNSDVDALVAFPNVTQFLMPTYNAALLEANDKVMYEYLGRTGARSLQERIRNAIEASLPDEPMQERIAANLNVSTRKLQRLLKDEGVTYQQVLDGYRREKSERWLIEGKKEIKQISDLLGFSNQSAFTRAFKRWNGLTPALYAKTRS